MSKIGALCAREINRALNRRIPWFLAWLVFLAIAVIRLPQDRPTSTMAVVLAFVCYSRVSYWRGRRHQAERIARDAT